MMRLARELKRNLCIIAVMVLVILSFNPFVALAAEETNEPLFTDEELEYIDEENSINVGLMQQRPPFSSYNAETGEFKGICVDVMDEISRRTGLEFNYIPMEITKTVPELMQTGEFDIICGIERDNFATSETLVATTEFMTSSVVPVARSGQMVDMNSELVCAIPKSFQALKKELDANHPNITTVGYDTSEACLDAVADGEADIFIQNTYLLGQLLQRPKYEKLDIMPVEIMTEHTAMVVMKDGNPMLLSILNKSIENFDSATLNTSLIKHTFAAQYQYKLSDYIRKLWLQILIIAVLVAACFTLLIYISAFRYRSEKALKKKNVLLADSVLQADMANVAKGQFLSRMSHEIRTPMNAIVGLTEIARQHKDEPDKIEDYLNKIDTSSKVLLNILNDVLDMSSIESGKLKIACERFDLKQILVNISTIYYQQCQDKGIEFRMSTDIENEILIGDSLRVSQILMNLVSNAYKFTETGAISITVEETEKRDNTVFIRFVVSDTGCGMNEEMLERLFIPFEQEDANTAKRFGGSGLGLSITKNLVGLMHGAIRVESKKDKGSTFTVDIPFEAVDTSDEDKKSVGSMRILVVDDDAAAREYTGIVLKRLGATYDTANSGETALKLLKEKRNKNKPYNVCLIDWKMDEMDGIALSKKIRELEDERTIIIIVSAYDLSELEEQPGSEYVNHFVTKPLFQSTLFNVLMQLTGGGLQSDKKVEKKYDFTGHRILLAEDQELNAEIATELMEMVGLEIDRAENGERVIQMFEDAAPDTYAMILMDIQMPVMDGYEATRAIRKLSRPDAKLIPIYAMTANAFTEDIATALSSGMNGHIAKPINTEILYSTINKVINGR